MQLLTAVVTLFSRPQVAWFDDADHSSGKLTANLATDATYVRGAVGDVFAVAFSVRGQGGLLLIRLRYCRGAAVECQHSWRLTLAGLSFTDSQNLSTLVLGYLVAFAYDWRMALLITGTLRFGGLFGIGLGLGWAASLPACYLAAWY